MDLDMQKESHAVQLLHRRIHQTQGWETVRGDRSPRWYETALTRMALLVHDEEIDLLIGDRNMRALLCLTEKRAVICTAPADQAAEAAVVAVSRSNLTSLSLGSGSSPFDQHLQYDWPGALSLELGYRDGPTVSVELSREGVVERLAPGWDGLLSDLHT